MQSIKPILEAWKAWVIPHAIDTELCSIYRRCGSDKKCETHSCHNYTNLYSPIFQSIRYQPFNFFELGLGTRNPSVPWNMCGGDWRMGASLYAAEEFFPNAQVYGGDIDRDILFHKGRIKTFYCNAKDPSAIKTMWNEPELKDKTFEIIIDDACHEFEANYTFALNSLHKLDSGGVFIIEDINHPPDELTSVKSSLIEQFNLDVFEFVRMRSGGNVLFMQTK